jgi:hypothetical protein
MTETPTPYGELHPSNDFGPRPGRPETTIEILLERIAIALEKQLLHSETAAEINRITLETLKAQTQGGILRPTLVPTNHR